MLQSERIELLQTMPVFGGVSTETLEFILRNATAITVRKGELFFHENDAAHSMYVLEHGHVTVLKEWQGRKYVLNVLGKGDCFGEIALLDFCARSASVQATSECSALELHFTQIHDVFDFNAQQFTLINMNIAREVARRLRVTDNKLLQYAVETSASDNAGVWHSV